MAEIELAAIDNEVLVTATRTPVPLADTLASASVITREEIEALQPLDLVDVFSLSPGLDISRSGGPGSAASLFTRGTASGHTLILVDGQRINSATLGSANFEFLNPEQIERIEIVRGTHSALYGSDAIGGVIQIFTRGGSGSEAHYVKAGVGSHDMYEVAAGTNGSSGNWRYGLNMSYLETDGIDNLVDDAGFNSDADGYRNKSVNGSIGYRFDNGADVRFSYLESDNRNEHDSAFEPGSQPYTTTRVSNANLRGRLPVTDIWTSTLSLGWAKDDSNNYDDTTGLLDSAFQTEREQLFWQNDFAVAEGHIVTVGYDYYEDELKSTSDFVDRHGDPVESRDNKAVLAEYQGDFEHFDVVLGAREDDNEAFGDHTTNNATLGLDLGARHQLVLGRSEGFKAPTFNDLYWPGDAFTAGNPDLDPEESVNYELSVRGRYDRWHWTLTYFDNEVENLINWAPGEDFVWRPTNVDDAEITGAEFIAGADVADWTIDASYTYVEARDRATDNLIPNRARSNLVVNVERPLGDWNLGLSLKAQDKRFADAANDESLSGYATLGARVAWQLTPALKASLKVDNLFDRDYQLNDGYNQDGRNWQLSMTYTL